MAEKKKPNFDSFINNAEKLFSFGEDENDAVVKILRRILSWCKYVVGLELMAAFIAGLPSYAIYKIKRGEIEELTETVIKAADVFFEETEEEIPKQDEKIIMEEN